MRIENEDLECDYIGEGESDRRTEGKFIFSSLTKSLRHSVRKLPPIWDLPLTNEKWIVDGLIPAGCITALTGASGVGKSFLTLALGDAVVNGTPFLERATVKRPVLFMDRENALIVVRERLDLLGIGKHRDFIYWGNFNEPTPPDPDDPLIVDFAEERPVIILDCLVAFNKGSEIDSTEMRRFMNKLKATAAKGVTWILIHHTGKGDNTKRYRGSSDIEAAVDAAYLLERPNSGTGLEKLTLKPFKMRSAREPEPITLGLFDSRFEVLSGGGTPIGRIRNDLLAIVGSQPGINRSELAKKLMDRKFGRNEANRSINEAVWDKVILEEREGSCKVYRLPDVVEGEDVLLKAA